MTTRTKKQRKGDAISAKQWLLTRLVPGDRLWCNVERVSRSGMLRVVTVKQIRGEGKNARVDDISWSVGRAIDWPMDEKLGGVKVQGCGTDVRFEIVNVLAQTLWWENQKEIRAAAGVARSDNWNGNVLERDAGYWLEWSQI